MTHKQTYDDYIKTKLKSADCTGFEPTKPINPMLFDWQRLIVRWALKRGCAALFEECGLGKTGQQIEWADHVSDYTRKPVLILCPLAVAHQTVKEGDKFGTKVTHVRENSDVVDGINITNYDRLDHFDCSKFGGVVLDESSILKSLNGKTRRTLTEEFAKTPFKLACTATPAPNDFTELGQHAEFLGVCTAAEMLATYFINDTFDTGTWRLKGHAVEPFWKWVASWAACVSKPSDLGFSDEGYDLPRVVVHDVVVKVDHRDDSGDELFRNPHVSATQFHAEQRRTLTERVQATAEIVNASTEPFIVWCESNEESEELKKSIPDAVEVRGGDSPEKKEDRLNSFSDGVSRVLVTKASIAGWGLNFQHCWQDIYVGMNHSFEKFYQAGKRIHRFGQKHEVHRYIVRADNENSVALAISRKTDQHNQMRELMKFTRDNLMENTSFVSMNTDIVKAESENWTFYNGDCVRVAKTLDDNSIGFSVFSPPFADLFTYSNDIQDMGNCNGIDEFMVQFGYLIDELHRITIPGRECAVHCNDLLATKWKDGDIEFKDFSSAIATAFRERGWLFHSRITIWKDPVTEMQRTKAHGLLYKTLKTDSSKSRVGAAEYLLVFRKRGENPKPITHTPEDLPLDRWQQLASPVWMTIDQGRVLNGKFARGEQDEKHICPLQLDVIENALTLWSAPGDTVFSPFGGIGSEGYCSVRMGRKFIGSELKPQYWKHGCEYLKAAECEGRDLFSFV
jgi:DNA modification methylase